MGIILIATLLGGLAIFLYGMILLGDGLEKSSAKKLKNILENLTSNPFKGVLLGAVVTAIIQSSSATTVMVVGFVNSGIMKLSQSVGIIMGANIGTTVTSWILSLTGISSDNIIITLLKPKNLALISSFLGIILIMFFKSFKKRDIGTIFMGFGILMLGMNMMSSAVEPLSDNARFQNILLIFQNPIIGVLMGAIVTAIIQSSSASVGILQALATTGKVRYASAIPIILGQNIGTCVTALLSSIGANKNAKRSAVIHLSFNFIGTLSFLIIYYGIGSFVEFKFNNDVVTPAGIAIVHTIFNVFSTLVMLPFITKLEKLAYFVVKKEEKEEEKQFLDERLLMTPSIAIGECKKAANCMAKISGEALFDALELLEKYSKEKESLIREKEQIIDNYEDRLGAYLVKVSQKNITKNDSRDLSNLLHSIGDFERIADHAVNLLSAAEEIHRKNIKFSQNAKSELEVVKAATKEIVRNTIKAFIENDEEAAKEIEPLEQVIDRIKRVLKSRHIQRLQKGECSLEMGFVFSDILTNIERVADHCSNIAVYMIQLADENLKSHEYLNNVKMGKVEYFNKSYKKYKEKYYI